MYDSPNKYGPVLGDEQPRRNTGRRNLGIAVVAIAAVAAVAVGYTMVSSKSPTGASNSSGGNSSSGGGGSSTKKATTESDTVDFGNSTSSGGGNGKVRARASTPTSDPASATFNLHALAIGDWGVSPAGDSCCSKYKKDKGPSLYRDEQAQDSVAYLLSLSAEELKPKVILSHGDNFYWNGIAMGDQAERFRDTFESKYKQDSLQNIPWLNVMGNHDYGGAAYICGDKDNEWRECTSEQEMLDSLDGRFSAQSKYVSPNGDRWKLPSHYYKETIKAGDVTVDIFNVDTNAATVHGADQVCCQCYGYAGPQKKTDPDYVDCNTVHRGHKFCYGGDNALFDSCLSKFTAWTDDSLKQLIADTQASKADWKIVNSHYSPHYHMDPPMMKKWFTALENGGVQLFINGHTHAESHDSSTGNVHFITNGAGGGIQSESIGAPPEYATNVKTLWSGADSPYGFFELSFAKEWMRARFITFDKSWSFAAKESATVKGSKQIGHCWYIPSDGSTGKSC
jgi:tartrate-resistant acid phosphatase type 5